MTTVISVENLSKSYQLGQINTGTFSNDLKVWWAKLRGQPNPLLRIGETDHGNRDGEELWALKDVSFTVEQGEVLGIIGRNGAGKSTLLKILSRVTAPTSGRVRVKGRIASLLEVGTGFHPELTGRENIYLNGAILGMQRSEIERKFDEIVDFAGVEKFIDTPVKRYSSGMYVRLAFAVAAHLDPEILVVDEVLAVGDAEFQKKCLGKMGDVARQGRTVLFVSHNMAAVTQICNKGLCLGNGSVQLISDIANVVNHYLSSKDTSAEFFTESTQKNKRLRILSACLMNGMGTVTSSFTTSQTVVIKIIFEVYENLRGPQLAFEFLMNDEICLFSTTSQDVDGKKDVLNQGTYQYTCNVELGIFRQGRYKIYISSSLPAIEVLDIPDKFLVFDLIDDSSPLLKLGQNRRGVILPIYQWEKMKLSLET